MRLHADALPSLIRGRFQERLDRGAAAAEYSLIVVLIAVVIIAMVTLFGQQTLGLFTLTTDAFEAVGAGGGGN